MLNIEIDGKATQVPDGSTVMDAASLVGVYIPHFCYHKKLSIAANCRMCLVEVEKIPKPVPACATPVTEGMKVKTQSAVAVKAQKGVMEFLLINHPLDCPICDQGGECHLQDLSVGYGKGASRYAEAKRVVPDKDFGPLIDGTNMTRCIHCTRCVRFGQEIAGIMELGMGARGEHSEIQTFMGHAVTSELSGNVIDLCPVGALTSKPFRFSARNWELARRKSVSPHDSLGSNLIVQVQRDRVKRVLPLENEAVNECWISDRDRFSYEGLASEDRLTEPMIKENGAWRNATWQEALEHVANGLKKIAAEAGPEQIGALAAPWSTVEELYLLQRFVHGLGSSNVDFRLRQADFSADARRQGAPWLGMNIAGLAKLERALVVGSFLRRDHPLLAQRLRQAARKGLKLSVIHSTADDLLMPLAHRLTVAPSQLPRALAEVLVAACELKGAAKPASVNSIAATDNARGIAQSLAEGERKAILLGNLAAQHPQASLLQAYAQAIAELTGASFGFPTEGANTVGGYLAGAWPQGKGLDARAMLASARKAYLLLHAEPQFDCADPAAALRALRGAEMVVAMTPFRGEAESYATVLLPVSPFTETSGTYINAEGRVQSFNGVVRPLGESRPAWKVLRSLGHMLGYCGFEVDNPEAVRVAALGPAGGDIAARLSNALAIEGAPAGPASGIERICETPIYFSDALVRRAASLQATADARTPVATMPGALWQSLGLAPGDRVRITQGAGSAVLAAARDDALPANTLRVPAAHVSTAALSAPEDKISVERAQ